MERYCLHVVAVLALVARFILTSDLLNDFGNHLGLDGLLNEMSLLGRLLHDLRLEALGSLPLVGLLGVLVHNILVELVQVLDLLGVHLRLGGLHNQTLACL